MGIFDNELRNLKEKTLNLGEKVKASIRRSIQSLEQRDSDLAREVIKHDHKINALEVEIDEECIRLIAIRQPKAKDLRFITTVMKITTDLERIADLAQDIAERAIELNEEALVKPYVEIPRMAQIAEKMLEDALTALIKKDSKLARDVINYDDKVDNINAEVFKELLSLMIKSPETISRATRITYISKYIERIADHSTNIAEMVIYLVEGKIIRHMDTT